MSVRCELLNGICKCIYAGEYRKFSAEYSIEKVQEEYLMGLMKNNADTVYGRKYGFDKIRSYKDFAERVPLTVYEDYEPYIERIAAGEKRVLTEEDIILFELTSGSSGGKKLIPYTRTLRAEFQRGIKPWLYDIYKNVKGVSIGKSYWSITPVTAGKSYTECGIPIGFEEDSEYFGAITRRVMDKLFAVGSEVKFSRDTDEFYTRTAQGLLSCGELTLISVWNPSLLVLLCEFIRDNAGKLNLSADIKKTAEDGDFERVFPRLKIISCWADGSAADCIPAVRRLFPNVYIQPKGLLATECFSSFPLVGEEGGRLSIYSHFFEFMSLEDNRIYPAHELEKGMYEIIVTTGGGFYRYRIGDIIQVLETYPGRPPRIRFIGRRGICSDLRGEKLTEDFVRDVCHRLGIGGDFCLLAPEGDIYCLYTDTDNITDSMLDKALRESYHYDYCRSLGQLGMARVIRITGDPYGAYIKRLTAEGMRAGDIKPAHLSKKSGWAEYFERKE